MSFFQPRRKNNNERMVVNLSHLSKAQDNEHLPIILPIDYCKHTYLKLLADVFLDMEASIEYIDPNGVTSSISLSLARLMRIRSGVPGTELTSTVSRVFTGCRGRNRAPNSAQVTTIPAAKQGPGDHNTLRGTVTGHRGICRDTDLDSFV